MKTCECITSISFNELFNHGLENCGATDSDSGDTIDDPDEEATTGEGDDEEETDGGDEEETDGADEEEDCPDEDEEFNTILCQCVSTATYDNDCIPPLIKDPVTKTDCISLRDFIAIYNHGRDTNCKTHGEVDSNGNFNFYFYGPVYGVNGVSNDQITNFNFGDDAEASGDEGESDEDKEDPDVDKDDPDADESDSDEDEGDPDVTTGFIVPGDAIFCIDCSEENPGTPLSDILPGFMWV